MNDLPSFYTVIPAYVRYNRALYDFDKLLYGEIAALTNANNYCWASNKYFAKVFAKSESTIKRSLSRLTASGVIISRVDVKNGNKRILTLSTPQVTHDLRGQVTGDPSRARPGIKKNNTRYNNGYSPSIDWFKDYLETQSKDSGGSEDGKD